MLIYRLKDPSRNASKRRHEVALILFKSNSSGTILVPRFCNGLSAADLFGWFANKKKRYSLCAEYLDVEDFPEHIKRLVQRERESEEQEKRQREIERNTCKVLHIYHLRLLLQPHAQFLCPNCS